MSVRLPKHLRDSFAKACKANDLTQSQVVRIMIKEYIARKGQISLF